MSKSTARLDKAIKDFNEIKRQMLDYMAKNEKFVSEFLSISEEYNRLLGEAKYVVRNSGDPSQILKVGEFKRTKEGEKLMYNPALLPSEVLGLNGVVKEVDTQALQKYVLTGTVAADVAERASYIKKIGSRVTAPKEIVVKL